MKKIIFAIAGILILLFSYGMLSDRSLGNGYKWVCYEPGCVVIDKEASITIYGDVVDLNLNKRYIFGKVDKPNKWMQEVERGYSAAGYFIINKAQYAKKIKMTKNEFDRQCKILKIEDCTLHYSSPLYLVFDWHYWYIMITDMFD